MTQLKALGPCPVEFANPIMVIRILLQFLTLLTQQKSATIGKCIFIPNYATEILFTIKMGVKIAPCQITIES